ncbi:MAG: hypothetical protein AB7G87_14460 [Clostridia bacterium]
MNKNFCQCREKIVVKEHTIERYMLRMQNHNISPEEAKKHIINQVRYSKLIKIENNEEHRLHKGNVYVIKREKGILDDTLVVVTMKITNTRKREFFSSDFSMEKVDFIALGA